MLRVNISLTRYFEGVKSRGLLSSKCGRSEREVENFHSNWSNKRVGI